MESLRLACPKCSGDLEVTPQFDWYCRSCDGSQVPRLDGVPTGFPDKVLDTFPFPLALTYQFVQSPDNATTGLMNLVGTYTSLVRFSALVLISQFLSTDIESPQSAQAVMRLRTPSLDSWHTALFTLAGRLFGPSPKGASDTPFSPELVRAIQSFKGARVGRQSAHELFRSFRNDEHGHKTAWAEIDCARHLAAWRPALDWVLALFDSLGGIEVLRKDHGEHVVMRGCREPLSRRPSKDPWLKQAFAESDVVLRNAEGGLLPLYPLFIVPQGSAESYLEDLLSFDGHGTQEMTFRGVRFNNIRRSEPLPVYIRLLDAKGAVPRISKQELRPWTLADWAFSVTANTIENLRGVKYFPQYYQERKSTSDVRGVDDTVESWLDRRKESALLVAATAGAGKTSLLCRIAEKLLEQSGAPGGHADCVLLLLGGQIRGGQGQLFARIRSGLGVREDTTGVQSFSELLDAWRVASREDSAAGERRLILLVDAVNESEDAKSLLEEASELAATASSANRKAGRAWVRFLLTVRTERLEALFRHWEDRHDTPFLTGLENFALYESERGRQTPYLELRSFLSAEAREAYARAQKAITPSCPVQWEDLVPGSKDLLRMPQMLSLFHRVYAGQRTVAGVTSEENLWRSWLDLVLGKPGSGSVIERLALDLADLCIDGGHDRIPAESAARWRRRWEERLGNDPLRIAAEVDDLERLAVAGLLRQTMSGEWDWVSDSLAEHVLLRALRRRCWPPGPDVIQVWQKFTPTGRLNGAMVHAVEDLWHEGRTDIIARFSVWDSKRAIKILEEGIARVALFGGLHDGAAACAEFSGKLRALRQQVGCGGSDLQPEAVLCAALLWGAQPRLKNRGASPASAVVARETSLLAERLAEAQPENRQAQSALATSYDSLGDLLGKSDPSAAHHWYERSLMIRIRLAEGLPDDLQAQRNLAFSCDKFADLAKRIDLAEVRYFLEEGLKIRLRLVAAEPNNLAALHGLSRTYSDLGDLAALSDPAAARNWFEKSLNSVHRVAETEPDNLEAQHDLSVSYSKLGGLAMRSDPAAAGNYYLRSLNIFQRLAQNEPDNLRFQRDLAVGYDQLGDAARRSEPAAAQDWYKQSLRIRTRLAEAEPDNREAQRDLSVSYNALGALADDSDPEEARQWFERSLEIAQRLARADPQNPQMHRDLSVIFANLANSATRSDPEAAKDWCERGLKTTQLLAEAEPDNRKAQRQLAVFYSNLGTIERESDPEVARSRFEQSLSILRRLAEAEPDNREALRDLAACCSRLGALAEDSDPEEARGWYEQSLEIQKRLAIADPHDVQTQRYLLAIYLRLGSLAARTAPATAQESYKESLNILQRLAQAEPDGADFRLVIAKVHARLAVALKAEGHLSEAENHYQEALEIVAEWGRSDPENSGVPYAGACIQAICGDCEKALRSLQQAVELGYRNADWAANDPDLSTLHYEPEFGELVSRMRTGGHI